MAYKSIARDEEERHKKRVESIADKARQKELKIKLQATKARQKEEMMVSCFLYIKYLEHISLQNSHASSLNSYTLSTLIGNEKGNPGQAACQRNGAACC